MLQEIDIREQRAARDAGTGIVEVGDSAAAAMLASTSPAHALDNNPSDPSNNSFSNSSFLFSHTGLFGDSTSGASMIGRQGFRRGRGWGR